MHLYYNILWIDDEIKKLEASGDITRISDYLIDLGFLPTIIQLSDGNDLERHLTGTKFDLIISDLSIEEGHHGDDIIKEIRSRKIFTEVLFYSSQAELKTIATKLLTVDRISFHAGRRYLLEKIEELISLSVSKLLELNATRGLITAETSELDVILEEMVMHLVYDRLKLTQDQIDAKISFYIEDFLKKSPESFMKKYSEHGFRKRFHSIEAMRKWSIFRELLKQLNCQEATDFLSTNKDYGNDVIGIRNKFAHAKSLIKEDKVYLAGFGPDGEAFEFNDGQCIEIRKRLIVHRENFSRLRDFFGIKAN